MQGDESAEHGILVVGDVTKDPRIRNSELLDTLSDVRFFASVPLITPRGLTIGCFSVMDNEVRASNLPEHSLQFMKEMAAAIMNHLVMGHYTHKSRQAERMLVGLGSFNEGKSTLRHSWQEDNGAENQGESKEGRANSQQQRIQDTQDAQETDSTTLVSRGPKRDEDSAVGTNHGGWGPDPSQKSRDEVSPKDNSVRSVITGESPQEDLHANSIKQVFSRAANLIRESIGTEGVIFLDAQSDRFRRTNHRTGHRRSDPGVKSDPSSSDESTDSGSSKKRDSSPPGQDPEDDPSPLSVCLGFSSSLGSSINNDTVTGPASMVHEDLLTALLRRYPRGKIFTYDANKSVSDESDGSTREIAGTDPRIEPNLRGSFSKKKSSSTFQKDAKHLITIFPEARSILLLPIWDLDKRRCFAGTLVWTNDPELVFTFENELMYVSAFANSIMAEINRLDVEMADKAKTRLLSSISHELRTPLHGILGTADILSDTAMNALQHGMVHTIESCGRTLLDTINNLLDLAFLGQNKKHGGKKSGERECRLPASSEDGRREQSKDRGEKVSSSNVRLDAVLEEVTESVFAGYSFYNHPKMPPPALTDSSSRSAGQTSASNQVGPRTSEVTIIFDIQPYMEWQFNTHPGAWRRILMNVFGNALKYTKSGYIYLGLKSSENSDSKDNTLLAPESSEEQEAWFEVTLIVKDTGKGIGPEYLQKDIFTPFMQEDSLMSGSGLGLSIVHQAVGSLGGSIEINSTQGVGTELSIRTPLSRSLDNTDASSSSSEFHSLLRYSQGKTIGFLGFGSSLNSQRDRLLYESLERLCHHWFGLSVTNVSSFQGEPFLLDFYLAVQTELDCEDTGGRDLFALGEHLRGSDGNGSPVVVICQSPEEAHHMFVTTKNREEAPIFEFISQPCGPRKLARALNLCIKRQRKSQSGRSSPDEPTRWVELPESSSHLPVDIEPRDPPDERMKISKRPTTETMGSSKQSGRRFSNEGGQQGGLQNGTSPANGVQEDRDSSKPSVLLVDDNDLNLQLLCAYAKKFNYAYMTARNGAEAVDIYKAHPDYFRVIILGTCPTHNRLSLYATDTNRTRYVNACHGWLRGRPPDPRLSR
jgi:signal transduction histidine kinase